MRPMHLFLILGCCVSLSECASAPTLSAVTVATVESVDAGIDAFARWAVPEEKKIAEEAIAFCKSKAARREFLSCVQEQIAPRRAPIDHAKAAIVVYRALLSVGDGAVAVGDITRASLSVIQALSMAGIQVKR